jgi:acetyltransferase-like isoleucine patch superfamily enzyme
MAWYIRGQKEQKRTGIPVPVMGFISEESDLIFPDNINLSDEVVIMPGAKIICAGMPPYLEPAGRVKIGSGSIVREGAIIQTYGGYIETGTNCTINPYCMLQGNGGIIIGDNVLISSHVSIYSANHRFGDAAKPIRAQGESRIGVKIGSDVWIGGGVVILDGVRIGDGAVVAAGAVVKRNVAPGTIVAGVPAKLIGKRGRTN